MMKRIAVFAGTALMLAACQDDGRLGNARAYQPVPAATLALMEERGMSKADPILIRSYKKESELEVWKRDKSGQYALLKTYPICRWSGQLGPKMREGDRQAPEGFYTITPAQMNPNSSFYLSFDTGFPNAYDRANGRSGAHLMVHGACSSRGCFSMTDEQIAEIYAIGRESFSAGQRSFQFQSYPFRMTAENMARHRHDPNIAFWKMLKEGSDHFEVTKREPEVGVCGRRYVFNAQSSDPFGRLDPQANCPVLKTDETIAQAVAERQRRDEAKLAEVVQKGERAVKLVYDDGGQHPSFRRTDYAAADNARSIFAAAPKPRFTDVSRPEALERGPQEIEIDVAGKPKLTPKPAAPPTAVALVPLTRSAPGTTPKPEAVSAPAAPVAAAVVPAKAEGEKPFYQRILSIGGLLSRKTEAAPPAEPVAPQPANVPVPPRRAATGQAPKPEAAVPPGRRADIPAALREAGSTWPSGLTAFAPLQR